MGTRGAYWQGIRLWEIFQEIKPWAQRTTGATHAGVEQKYAKRNADSHNFERPVQIATVLEANRTGVEDAPDWVGVLIELLDVEKDLTTRADTKPQGDLVLTYATEHRASVTGGGSYTGDNQVIPHAAPPAAWVRTAGRYVLARDPATNEGFAAEIEAVDTSATDITIDVPTGYTVDSSWEFIDVQVVFPDASYRGMDGGNIKEWEEQGSPDVLYEFDCEEDPLYSSDYVTAHDDS